VKQARSSLAQTEASIPPLALGLRQANDQLCVLLGQPARDLTLHLHEGPIPKTPPEAAVGIPRICSNVGPTCAGHCARRRRKARKSALPKRISILTSA
jgi:hypothetical protein